MREIFDLYSYLKISGAQAAGRRLKAREAGIHVPVFLQADISVHCNLSCPGCENGYIHTKHQEELMTVNEWDVLFREAEKLGIRFFFLTGGEPLMEREILERAARYLEGTHDFSSFTIDRTPGKSKVRTIRAIRMEQQGNLLLIRYEGDGFLYNMVRILTGTLLEVGDGRKQAEDIPGILEKKQRVAAGFTAPAQGLFLERVLYEEADIQEQC